MAALCSQTLLLHALCGEEGKHAAFNTFLAPGGQKKKPLKVKMREEELLPPAAGHTGFAAVDPGSLQFLPFYINSYKSHPFLCPHCVRKAPLKILLQGSTVPEMLEGGEFSAEKQKRQPPSVGYESLK